MVRVLVASTNPGKLREFTELLQGLPARLVTPRDLGLSLEVEETGATYAANAALKAEAFARAAGLVTVGDDSGLEVAALGGAPGVFSARSAGPGASDADRRRKLLGELAAVPSPRPARFVAALAVARPAPGAAGPDVRLFEGVCPGEIALEERGSGGFGYDPVFYLPEFGLTLAELPPEVKNRVSHRARAVAAARHYLLRVLQEAQAAAS